MQEVAAGRGGEGKKFLPGRRSLHEAVYSIGLKSCIDRIEIRCRPTVDPSLQVNERKTGPGSTTTLLNRLSVPCVA